MKTRAVKVLVTLFLLGLLLGGGALGVILWHIYHSVETYRAVAQRHHPHPGDDITALIDFVNSDLNTRRSVLPGTSERSEHAPSISLEGSPA